MKEAEDQKISLDDDDLDSVRRMLPYMYTRDYGEEEELEADRLEKNDEEADGEHNEETGST